MARSAHEDADKLWSQCRDRLGEGVSADVLDTWLAPLQPQLDGDSLLLFAPNEFVIDEVRARWLESIRAALPASLTVALRLGARPKYPGDIAPSRSPPAPPSAAEADPPPPGAKAPAKARSAQVSEPGYLPFIWGDASRAIPNVMVRCALFTVNTYGPTEKRPRRERTKISSQDNISVFVTGDEANIFDRDVMMQLLQYQRSYPVTQRLSFSARQVLQDLGLPTSGINIKRLIASIERLHETHLRVEQSVGRTKGPNVFGSFNLIAEFYRDETNPNGQNWVISFSETVAAMLGEHEQTRLIWAQSQQLGSALAKGLHGYYASHKAPYPVSVEFLRQIVGSNIKELFKFRYQLKKALNELVDAGFLLSWEIQKEKDLVHVKRAPLSIERYIQGRD